MFCRASHHGLDVLRSTPVLSQFHRNVHRRTCITSRVTFTAADLENNPTQFAVGLQGCGEVLSVEYDDEQGNSPDFSKLPDPTCFEVGKNMTTIVNSAQDGPRQECK